MADIDTIGDLYDKLLLAMLKRGKREVLAGDQVREVDLSSSDLAVIRGRLKDCGVTTGEKVATSTEELRKTLEELDIGSIREDGEVEFEDD